MPKLKPHQKRRIAWTMAQENGGVTAAEFAKEVKVKTVGPMAKLLNKMTEDGYLTMEAGGRDGKDLYKVDPKAEMPEEIAKTPRKKKPGRKRSTSKAPKASTAKASSPAKSQPVKDGERAIDTLRRLASAGEFTLLDLAVARNAKQVGPFMRTIQKALKDGELQIVRKNEDGKDVYAALGAPKAPASKPAKAPKVPASQPAKAAGRVKKPRASASPLPLDIEGAVSREDLANLFESIAKVLRG